MYTSYSSLHNDRSVTKMSQLLLPVPADRHPPPAGWGSPDFHELKALVRLGFLNVGIVQYYISSPYCITDYGIML